MKKLFIAIPTLASAGAERFATELACNINREKFECYVIVTKKLEKKSAFYNKLLEEGIEVIDISNSNYLKEVVVAIKLIRKERPVVVHTNVGSALHMLLPIILSGVKTKHIFTAHSMGYRIFSGAKKRLIKFCFKRKLIIPVGICDTVQNSLVEAYDLKREEVECVYNGVDTTLFNTISRNNRKNVTFVTVGTLYYIKNHRLLIEAFKITHEQCNNTRLCIVGAGELREELESYVNELGLGGSVVFEGNKSDVAPYLLAADVYCCTSLVEGLPISVLEAMATGLPVISTPAGGVVDIVKNGVNGYITEANANAISEQMLSLAKNKDFRMSLGAESRKLAEKYDIKNCAQGYEKLYEKYSS